MEVVRQKNVATIIVFPIVDADGDLVSGATTPDSEIDAWTDGAAPDGFADCTNEATEIGSTGNYYLSLTQTEMNNDYIVVQVKTATAGAKTQVILIRTMVGDPLNFAVTDDGTAINVASGIVEAQVKSIDANAITATAIATGAIDADAIADNAIDAGAIAADAITAAKLASDVTTELQSGLATAANLATVAGYLDTEVAAILADTNELQTDLADGGRLDLLVDAIKAKTDNLPSDPADASVVAGLIAGVDAKVDIIDSNVDAILVDTGTTLQGELDGISSEESGGQEPLAGMVARKGRCAGRQLVTRCSERQVGAAKMCFELGSKSRLRQLLSSSARAYEVSSRI